jgi:hypothetical protein
MSTECALLARELHEPLRGTAPEAVGWLCLEQPGAWGRDAADVVDLPASTTGALAVREDPRGRVRLQLLRRPAGIAPDGPRSAFLVHAGPERRWVRRLRIDDPAEIGDVDLDLLRSPEPPALGEPHDDPLVLVCTHAKRDACCARWGRPVATALAEQQPELVWESSHVGGHRFAGNVLMLPTGLTYGALGPQDALRVLGRHLDGLVDLEALRGRAGLPRPAQAAEWYVRDRSAARGIDEVILHAHDRGPDTATYEATVGDVRYRVTVREADLGTPRLTGCDKDTPADPGTWELADLEILG